MRGPIFGQIKSRDREDHDQVLRLMINKIRSHKPILFLALVLVLLLVCISGIRAQELVLGPDFSLVGPSRSATIWQNPVPATTTMQYGPTPADAVAYALADIAKLSAADQPFQRYIWIPDGDRKKRAYVNYTLNLACSRASTIINPTVVADGKLLRCDLRILAPREGQYATMHALWEELAFEPYFHITKTTADALPTSAVQIESRVDDPPGSIRFKVGEQIFYKSPGNEFFILQNNAWIKRQLQIAVQRVVTYGVHVGLEQGVLLQSLSKSNAAVIRYDFFIAKVLSTTDGGLYWQFAGIERNPSSGTAQAAFLKSLGASETLVASLRSDQRVAMFRSKVTGKPRRIDAFYGVGVRPGSGTGLITITHDMVDNDTNPRSDPIRNLLQFQDAAREVIAVKPNGMQIFALFNSQGALVDSVPDNIARDHTIPAPHTGRLQAAIGCIRCHGPHDGYQPFTNEVKVMLGGLLDVYGDVASRRSIPDQLDRLAGLYSGDLSKPIRRGRDDYSDAVFLATGGMKVSDTSAGISQIYGDYVYKDIGAFEACAELGYLVPQNRAVYYLNQILPPLNADVIGIRPEDPIIGALKVGLRVNRYQWEQVYADAAFRALQTRKTQENIQGK